MPVYKVFMEYNQPMYGEFFLGVEKGVELDDYMIQNFLHWNIENIDLEEDYHTDRVYDVREVKNDSKMDDVWWIDKSGEQIERPEPEPTVTQLELF